MLLRAPSLEQFPWLVHGFSTRLGGTSSFDPSRSAKRGMDLNLGKVAWDSAKQVAENRRRWLARLQAKGMKLVLQRQVHSDLIRTLDAAFRPSSVLTGDALITNRPGLLLGILTADCLPILLVDARRQVVAALHCGWRGTAKRLAEKAVGRMRLLFGSQPEDLWAAIGPGIRSCCYAVGDEVVEEFSCQFPYSESLFVTRARPLTPIETKRSIMIQAFRSNFGPRTKKETHLDLPLANFRQLRDAGVPEQQIASDAPCTSCHPELFFSHRREAGHTGRMMGVVGIRKNV
jgi:YfiH family protein